MNEQGRTPTFLNDNITQMIFLIDNYDSFTYNLYQYLCELGEKVVVRRNDGFRLEEIEKLKPQAIIISPGPGSPRQAGSSKEVIKKFSEDIPILGVCLGHQCIGEVFGGKIVKAGRLMHGKTSPVSHDNRTIFRGLENPFTAGRYHSLIIDEKTLPDTLEISARDEEGVIMGIRHRAYRVEGVQFHPESILTTQGRKLLQNFLSLSGTVT